MAENETMGQSPTGEPVLGSTPTEASTPIEAALSQEVVRLVGEIDRLGTENAELQRKSLDVEQQNVRLLADYENLKKRTQREKDELGSFVTARLLLDILPVIDNFDRARTHAQFESEREEKLHNSYQQVYRQFQGILEKQGVQPLEVLGQPFDPALHEAVLREESSEVTRETVVMELQKGYFLGEKMLRPAMVKVAVPPARPPVEQPFAEE